MYDSKRIPFYTSMLMKKNPVFKNFYYSIRNNNFSPLMNNKNNTIKYNFNKIKSSSVSPKNIKLSINKSLKKNNNINNNTIKRNTNRNLLNVKNFSQNNSFRFNNKNSIKQNNSFNIKLINQNNILINKNLLNNIEKYSFISNSTKNNNNNSFNNNILFLKKKNSELKNEISKYKIKIKLMEDKINDLKIYLENQKINKNIKNETIQTLTNSSFENQNEN